MSQSPKRRELKYRLNTWIKEFRKERLDNHVTQAELAVYAGLSREYLNRIESGKLPVSEDLKKQLTEALELLKPDAPLFMLIDYFKVRFKTTDIRHVVENILHIKMKYMGYEDYGFYSYSEHYYHGDIVLMVSPDEEKGILLELKGKGCRQYESCLLAQGRDWYEFINDCIREDAVMKRIDLAINDRAGLLDVPELIDKCTKGECVSVFKKFDDYGSGTLIPTRDQHKVEMGKTLYLGSKESELYFCIYEKAFEQYTKNGIPLEDADIKNRLEIRLKNERAFQAAYDLLAYRDAEQTAFAIINRYVRFVDAKPGKDRYEWKENAKWQHFIGDHREKLRLTTKPKEKTIDDSYKWVHDQVAPTLKTMMEIDRINSTAIIENMIEGTELSEKQQKIIEQQTTPIQDIIC